MKTIWVNGTFDILQVGHIRILRYAKSLGDKLIVGIDSDKRVKKLKGIDRPINNQAVRKEILLAIDGVDKVVIFGSNDELKMLIKRHKIDILVAGHEYADKEIVGNELVDKVMFFNKKRVTSSTEIINKIYANRNNRV